MKREKTYLRTRAPSEDSDQPALSRSLIRVFTGRMQMTRILDIHRTHSEDSDSTAQTDLCLRWADNGYSDQTALMRRL